MNFKSNAILNSFYLFPNLFVCHKLLSTTAKGQRFLNEQEKSEDKGKYEEVDVKVKVREYVHLIKMTLLQFLRPNFKQVVYPI